MKKSKNNEHIERSAALTLIVTTGKDNDESAMGTSTIADDQFYEFYLDKNNLTPKEIVNTKYPTIKCDETPCRSKMTSKTRTIKQDDDNYIDFFLKIDKTTVNYLLDELLPNRKPTDTSAELKYDIGSHIPFSRENIITKGYEVELTESQTFSILDLPGSITIKGDGDYERIQSNKNFLSNYRAKPRVKIDNIAQTINSFTEREDKDCQTKSNTISMVGTQVHDFNIIDAALEVDEEQNVYVEPILTKTTNIEKIQHNSEKLIKDIDAFVDKTMFVERILAQNTLSIEQVETNELNSTQTEQILPEYELFLKYCFTLKLDNINKSGLLVKCMHWNEMETHLLAVAYSKSIYDFEDKMNAVAIWSTKNPYTPERYYELSESAITCLRFSNINPNRLAIGFYCGEILIINISNKNLDVVYQKSKQLPLDTNGVLNLFWTVKTENELGRNSEYECLVTSNFSGCITHYRHLDEAFEEKIIMQLSQNDNLIEGDNESFLNTNEISKQIFSATKFTELNQTMYLVGTGDGLVHICSYDNSMKHSTKIIAHFGIIKSLEKSPFSCDVYLTTGCDCSINIWIGDIFIEPIISLKTDQQIEKAIWSRTNSSVIASIEKNSILIWDMEITKCKPILVHEQRHSNHKCSGIEFTWDGKYLCVSDTGGKIVIYSWNTSSITNVQEHDTLMFCIAKSLYGKPFLPYALCKARPEYFDIFAKLHNEKQKSYYS